MVFGVFARSQVYHHRQGVIGVEAGIHILQRPETLDHQARDDEKYGRHDYLGNYKNAADSLSTAPSG